MASEPRAPASPSLRSASLTIALAVGYAWATRVPMNGWAACAACATVAFVFLMLIATTSMQRVFAIGAGLALASLGVASPQGWVLVTWGVASILGLAYAAFPRLRLARVPVAILAALGGGFPAAVLVAIALLGGADSVRAFGITLGEPPAAALLQGGRLIVVAGLAVSSLDGVVRVVRDDPPADRTLVVHARVAGAVVAALLLARLTWVLSIATLPTDAVSWSEPPLLVNMLKLRTGAVLYGPLEDANSYTYSPGIDLLHYALLRPLSLELSLGAHRTLALAWQALAVTVLTRTLRRLLEPVLSPVFGRAAPLALAAAVAVAIASGTNAPYVHPDQPVKLLFAISLAFVIELPALSRRSLVAGLVLLPPLATMCKLTAAGIGVGLGLALIADRRPRGLVALGAGGVAALATIPLFDALFGHFTTYAIRVQASHAMEWLRAWSLLWRPEGQAVLLAVVAVVVASMRRPRSATVAAAGRVLLLTAGFGGVSSISYLKRGGSTTTWSYGPSARRSPFSWSRRRLGLATPEGLVPASSQPARARGWRSASPYRGCRSWARTEQRSSRALARRRLAARAAPPGTSPARIPRHPGMD